MSDIIQEIRSGNKDAVKSVYQEYAKDVYNFAKSITGDHDSALAATKKTFLNLFKNIKNGEEPANIRTAALKLAYDEAYKMAAPKEEAAEDWAPEDVQEAPAAEEAVYAEEYEERQPRRSREEEPAAVEEDDYETASYEEEEDGFVPPQRQKKADREEVYRPDDQYDSYEEEAPEEEPRQRPRRKAAAAPAEESQPRRGRKAAPADGYEDEYYDEPQPRRGRRPAPADDYEDEYYDEPQPRRGRSRNDYDRVSSRGRAQDVDVYDALDEEENGYNDYDDDYEEEKKPRSKGLFIFCIILNVVLIIILLWFLGGLLVNLGILPDIDLGYSWFNGHIYPLF